MKILQICPGKLPLINRDGKIFGGAEKFCLDFAKLQVKAGNEITNLVAEGTDISRVSGECVSISLRNKDLLVSLASQFDVVVYHLVGQSGMTALTNAKIPVVMIWHMTLQTLGISKFGLFNAIESNRRIGGKLLGVSKNLQNKLNQEFKKTHDWCVNRGDYASKYVDNLSTINCDFGEILQFIYSDEEPPEVLPSNSKGFVLSQISNIRNPLLALECMGNRIDYFVSYKDTNDKYVKKFSELALRFPEAVNYNLKYSEIQERIRNYKFLLNPCTSETAGYSVFETGMKGIPTVLLTDPTFEHASEEFFSGLGVIKIKSKEGRKRISNKIMKSLIEEAIHNLPESLDYRKEIQRSIVNKFTEERVVNIYNNVFKSLGGK